MTNMEAHAARPPRTKTGLLAPVRDLGVGLALASVVAGCGGSSGRPPSAVSGGRPSSSATPASTTSTTTTSAPPSSATTTTTAPRRGPSVSGPGPRAAAPTTLPDPNLPGPYSLSELDETAKILATGHSVPLHVAYPSSGPGSGPYPLVVIGHGFQLAGAQYHEYARRLASFGFVAVVVDFPTPLFGGKDLDYAADLAGAIDWAVSRSAASGALAGLVDSTRCGAMGHSLGGKVAIIAASIDPRIRAVVGLDPVDASSSFSGGSVRARDVLPLPIPTCFLGETLDGAGGFLGQPCAPKLDNFESIFQKAASPSLSVTVAGASHTSFLDAPASAGLAALVCNAATAPHDDVHDMALAFTVAFFQRTLAGIGGYDDDLVGARATARYVASGLATIDSSKW